MVKESHHKVDPCPLCAPGQMIRSSENAFTSARRRWFHLSVSRAGSRIKISEILVKYPAEVPHMEPVGWKVVRCASGAPSQLYALRQRPLGELLKGLQPSVFSLIPLDLNSCLKRRVARFTPTAQGGDDMRSTTATTTTTTTTTSTTT